MRISTAAVTVAAKKWAPSRLPSDHVNLCRPAPAGATDGPNHACQGLK